MLFFQSVYFNIYVFQNTFAKILLITTAWLLHYSFYLFACIVVTGLSLNRLVLQCSLVRIFIDFKIVMITINQHVIQ